LKLVPAKFSLRSSIALAVLLLTVWILYRPVLQGDFVYDDLWYLVHNPFVHQSFSLRALLSDPRTAAAPSSGLATDVYRPLSTLWFWADAHLWGAHPFPYHVENLLLHGLNGLLLFWLLLKWMKNAGAAFLGTAVFLLHPVQVQSVAWITQRSTVASTTAQLAALLLLVEEGPPGKVRAALGFVCVLAAMLLRETAFVFPLLFGMIVWPQREKRGKVLGLAALSVAALGVRYAVLHQWSQFSEQTSYLEHIGWGVLAFPVYAGKLLWPVKLRVSYGYPIFHGSAFLLAGFVWMLYALSLFFLRKDRWASLGLLWIGAGLLPVLQIIPIRAFVAERFLYVPMIGVAILVARASEFKQGQRLCRLWLLFLAWMTWRTTPAWKNEVSLWAEAVRHEPENAFARSCYAAALPNPRAAIEQYQRALGSHPSADLHFTIENNLAEALLRQGSPGEALLWAHKAVEENPTNAAALYNLGRALERSGHPQEAAAALQKIEFITGKESGPARSLREEIGSPK
jgi:tetratricopeptide (TPR) repeat protein